MKKIILILFTILFFLPCSSRSEDFDNGNLVIVMDCSGSMDGKKIGQAKHALKEILNYVPNNTHIGLLAFGGSQSGWKYDLGPRNDNQLIRAINSLKTGGRTPLGEYMKYGAQRLLKQKEKQLGYGNYRLLVITDGEASDQDLVDKYTPDIMAKGINVDLIGVYMNTAHSLSRMVHSYREAHDTASLKQAIEEVLAEISDKKDTTTTDDAFGIIAGIPQEMATEIISAISSTADQPIGEGEGSRQFEKERMSDQRATSNKKAPQAKSPGALFGTIFLFFFVFIIIIIIQFLFKKR